MRKNQFPLSNRNPHSDNYFHHHIQNDLYFMPSLSSPTKPITTSFTYHQVIGIETIERNRLRPIVRIPIYIVLKHLMQITAESKSYAP